MLNSDDHSSRDFGWRFHAPVRPFQNESDASSGKRETPRRAGARYSRSLAHKLKKLSDGAAVRFQIGGSRFMAMKIGSELFVRPFGTNSDLRVNGVPAMGMTRITWNDCLQIGGRSILLRQPRCPEAQRNYNLEKLLELPDEPQNNDVERERQKRAGYRDPSRPPEGWGE